MTKLGWGTLGLLASGLRVFGQEPATNSLLITDATNSAAQNYNWHIQNTATVQYHPGFSALYSGPNSLSTANQVKETLSLDLYGGLRLWRGAEAHVDALVWQGFGFNDTRGVEAFPNGEAFRLGTEVPNINLARVFLRQELALDGDLEPAEDGPLQLAGTRSTSRLVLTVGRFSAKDIFDLNAYANDSREQFMSWGLMANEAWDYPADSLGYITGAALELYLQSWRFRYGFFRVPRTANGTALDSHFLEAWGMVGEIERQLAFGDRKGAVRLLVFVNRANMGSLSEAVGSQVRPADIQATREYRTKWGIGLSADQELLKNIGAFLRLGWNDGATEPWNFADVDHAATGGLSIGGALWNRPGDTWALGGGVNAISRIHREFLAAGGLGILAGDGALTYGSEQFLETYYRFEVCKWLHLTADYQFIANPAFNRDRGPVSVLSGRLHWEF